MSVIKVDGEEFVRVELAYMRYGEKNKFVVYSNNPHAIDMMINHLVEFQAEKKAKEDLKIFITEKVSQLLNL